MTGGAGMNAGFPLNRLFIYGSTGAELFRRAWEFEIAKHPGVIGSGWPEPEADLALYFGGGVRLPIINPLHIEINPTYHLIFGDTVDGLVELRVGVVNLFDI
jgi:hypothetical protein